MSIESEKQDVFKKLTIAQQKKLSIQQQIDYLKAEQEEIQKKAKRQQELLQIKQNKLLETEGNQKRKDDTRRKILFGAWVTYQIHNNPDFKQQLTSSFENYLRNEHKDDKKKRTPEQIAKDMVLFTGMLWDE